MTYVYEGPPSLISTEQSQFWKHLALSGMIGGIDVNATAPEIGKSHPAPKTGGVFHVSFVNHNPTDYLLDIHQNMLMMKPDLIVGMASWWWAAPTSYDQRAISPRNGYRIDKKIDDGVAMSGLIQANSAGGAWGCSVEAFTFSPINGPEGYTNSNKVPSCELYYKLSG